jgi:adenylate cyclase
MLRIFLFIIGFNCCVCFSMAQENIDSLKLLLQSKTGEDSVKAELLLEIGRSYQDSDPSLSMKYINDAKELAAKIGYKRGIAFALKIKGTSHYIRGEYPDALGDWKASLAYFDSIADRTNVARLLSNIGLVYFNNGDEANALDNHLKSLKVGEEIKDTQRIVTAMNNIGVVYMFKKATYDKALQYFTRALPLGEKIGDQNNIGSSCVNLGELYFSMGDSEKALFYFKKSLEAYKNTDDIAYSLNSLGKLYASKGDYAMAKNYHDQAFEISKKLSAKQDMTISLLGLADVYVKQKDYRKALTVFKRAEVIATEIRSANELKDTYKGLSMTYSNLSDFTNAFKYQTLLTDIKDTLYNIATDKKLLGLQFDFEIQKKEGQINLLTKDKALQELELKRQRIAKNALLAGMILVTLIIFIIYRDYRNKIKTNKILDSQKAEIESLLLNILPAEVAQELQKTGTATPRFYEKASVLFTDFKSFSKLADALSPQEVVTELNECFIAFDDIIHKYNLEKIKTIGDSYMCAGGIPTADEDHVVNIIRASMEIQHYIISWNEKRRIKNMPAWEIRIGINTGPLVAGVVGKKKYAYDIWGGTVNIASRMESNGEPGKINISEATYELIKEKFACTYRGKIYAKNIGEIDMYFVDHELV